MPDLKRLEDKIDIVVEKIANIDKTLSSQHEILGEHIRRTEALEEYNKLIVEPIRTWKEHIVGACKLLGTFSGIVIVLASIVEIIVYFKTGK